MGDDRDWEAHSFLATTPLDEVMAGQPRRVVALSAFSWGFTIRDADITLRPSRSDSSGGTATRPSCAGTTRGGSSPMSPARRRSSVPLGLVRERKATLRTRGTARRRRSRGPRDPASVYRKLRIPPRPAPPPCSRRPDHGAAHLEHLVGADALGLPEPRERGQPTHRGSPTVTRSMRHRPRRAHLADRCPASATTARSLRSSARRQRDPCGPLSIAIVTPCARGPSARTRWPARRSR
jgi:hypothetical protein